MKRKLGVAATAAMLALALTLVVSACGGNGGGNGGASSAADRESDTRDAALRQAQCMREHGVDMPDPTFEPGGGVAKGGPDENVPRATLAEAEQACQKYLDEIAPPPLSEEEQQEYREAALAHSRCMREHGIENFPDPTFDADGMAELMLGEGSGIDPEHPDFKEAEEACQDQMPQWPSEETAP
jgi:hypothetical protein